MDRILQMILNRLLGRLIKTAVGKGVDYAAGPSKPRDQITGADREQARQVKETLKRARQAAKLGRRLR